LKYDKDTKESVIKDIQKVNRVYVNIQVLQSQESLTVGNLLVTGKKTKQLNVGGEVICYVY
jgi:small subunit ribosomal protein S8